MPHSYGASFSGVRWLGLMSFEKSRMSTTSAPPAAMKSQTYSQLVRCVLVMRKTEAGMAGAGAHCESPLRRTIPNDERGAQLSGHLPGYPGVNRVCRNFGVSCTALASLGT